MKKYKRPTITEMKLEISNLVQQIDHLRCELSAARSKACIVDDITRYISMVYDIPERQIPIKDFLHSLVLAHQELTKVKQENRSVAAVRMRDSQQAEAIIRLLCEGIPTSQPAEPFGTKFILTTLASRFQRMTITDKRFSNSFEINDPLEKFFSAKK